MKCPICGGPLVSRTEEVTYRGIRIGEFRAWHSSDCGETILDHRAWSAVKRYDEFLAGRRTPTAVVDSPVGAVLASLAASLAPSSGFFGLVAGNLPTEIGAVSAPVTEPHMPSAVTLLA